MGWGGVSGFWWRRDVRANDKVDGWGYWGVQGRLAPGVGGERGSSSACDALRVIYEACYPRIFSWLFSQSQYSSTGATYVD